MKQYKLISVKNNLAFLDLSSTDRHGIYIAACWLQGDYQNPTRIRDPCPSVNTPGTFPPNLFNVKASYPFTPYFPPSLLWHSKYNIYCKATPTPSSTPLPPLSHLAPQVKLAKTQPNARTNHKQWVLRTAAEDKRNLEFPVNPSLQGLCLPYHRSLQSKDHEFLLPRTRIWIPANLIHESGTSHLLSSVSSY